MEEDIKQETETTSACVAITTHEELSQIIKKRDKNALKAIFDTVPNIDIAKEANELDVKELIFIFRTIPSSLTSDFFDELSQEVKENLIKAMTDKELVVLINELYADDVADTLDEMPANLASKVLKAASKDMRKDINTLLKYADGTAGSIMTTEYLEFLDTATVTETIDKIRERGKDAETIYTVFVRDKRRNFLGTVDLDDLIFASKEATLSTIMNKDIAFCHTGTDQEEVGRIFRRYDLNALAVLNGDERLVGIITIDDAVDVMTEESSEDIAHLTKMTPTGKPYMELSPLENAKKCIPWIIALLVLGTFSSMVLSIFENKLQLLPILAAFIPTLMDTGGNAGGQTTGLMIRGLALNDFRPKDFFKVLWKEFRSALIVAAIIAGFAFFWLTFEQYMGIVKNTIGTGGIAPTIWNGQCWTLEFFGNVSKVSGLVSLTMFIAVLLSKLIGTMLPLGAAAIKKDPALLSQPMLTTIMDIVSLLVYFGVAIAFFPSLLG